VGGDVGGGGGVAGGSRRGDGGFGFGGAGGGVGGEGGGADLFEGDFAFGPGASGGDSVTGARVVGAFLFKEGEDFGGAPGRQQGEAMLRRGCVGFGREDLGAVFGKADDEVQWDLFAQRKAEGGLFAQEGAERLD